MAAGWKPEALDAVRRGLYRHYGKWQMRAGHTSTIGVLGGGFGSLAAVRSYAATYWCPSPLSVETGIVLQNDVARSIGPGGSPPLSETQEYRLVAPLLGASLLVTGTGYLSSVESYIEIVDLKIWRYPFAWEVTWQSWEWVVNGATQASGGAGSCDNDWVTHSGVPIIGVPPIVGCIASADSNPRLPIYPPPGAGAFSLSASGTATGGWRFQEPGSSSWVSLPCTVAVVAPPAVSCPLSAPLPTVGGSDCWSLSATSSSSDIYDDVTETLSGGSGWVGAVPNCAASVSKEGGDYSALVYRFGMPRTEHYGYALCSEYTPDDPGTATDDEELTERHPLQSEILGRVTGGAHAMEDTLGFSVPAPYSLAASVTAHSRTAGRLNRQEASFPVVTASSTQAAHLEHSSYNLSNYVNYWGSRHMQYVYWLPRDDGGPPQWPPGTGGMDYWSYLREQFNSHPTLPVGEDSKSRNCLASACYDWGALSSWLFTYMFANSRTSWWGSSRFVPVKPAVPSTLALTDASAASWTGDDCSVSVGALGVTVTDVVGTGKADYDLGNFDTPPYMYWLICGSLTVDWETANVASMTVKLIDPQGKERTLTSSSPPVTVTVGAAASESYAGSWAQDYGALALTDVGVDTLGTGVSASLMADPSFVAGFQLSSGRSGHKLRFEVVPTDPLDPVLIKFPVLRRAPVSPTAPVWVHETSSQGRVLFADGPAFGWGLWNWWNPLAGVLAVPQSRGPGSPPTMLDALCAQRAVFEGVDRTDGLDTALAGLYPDMTRARASEFTVAWWLPVSDWPRFAVVDTFADHPPMSCWPTLDRDAATMEPTGPTYVLTTWDWAYGTRNYVSKTSDSSPAQLWTAGGAQVTATATDPVTGWRLATQSAALTGGEAADYEVRHDGTAYAKLRPWHGNFSLIDLGATSSGGLSYDVSDSFRHARSRTDTSGVLVATAANDPFPPTWNESLALSSGVWACLRYGRRRRDQRLWMARESVSATVALYRSDDDGRTWATTGIVGPGTKPTMAVLDDGGFLVFRRSGSDLVAQRYDAQGTAVGAPFAAVTGVDDEGCAAVRLRDGSVAVLYVASGSVCRAVMPGPSSPAGAGTLIEAGKKPAMAVSPSGESVEVWLDGSGKVRARWLDQQGLVIVATHDAVASGADDEGPAVGVSVGQGGDLRACLLYVASGVVVQLANRAESAWL